MPNPKLIDRRDNPRDKSFILPIYCHNCDFKGKIKISKGVGSDHRIRWTVCPNCGMDGYNGLTRSHAPATPQRGSEE